MQQAIIQQNHNIEIILQQSKDKSTVQVTPIKQYRNNDNNESNYDIKKPGNKINTDLEKESTSNSDTGRGK